ncbi:hypothetical protein ACFQQB_48575 [Nonomuraea rubra]|uniref:hypothetical protein n=1 Tax=Nonomuraea rubra TaxID=46180 RepID=UPI0036079889
MPEAVQVAVLQQRELRRVGAEHLGGADPHEQVGGDEDGAVVVELEAGGPLPLHLGEPFFGGAHLVGAPTHR